VRRLTQWLSNTSSDIEAIDAKRGTEIGARLAKHCFRECNEPLAMRHTAAILRRSGHRTQIVTSIVGPAARTEQQSVTGRSIETLISRP